MEVDKLGPYIVWCVDRTYNAAGARTGEKVSPVFGGDWTQANDHIDALKGESRPLRLISYRLRDVNGDPVPRRRDGWSLREDGVPVCACSFCGTVGPYDKDCCEVEFPF